jgi:hypothetical protein
LDFERESTSRHRSDETALGYEKKDNGLSRQGQERVGGGMRRTSSSSELTNAHDKEFI